MSKLLNYINELVEVASDKYPNDAASLQESIANELDCGICEHCNRIVDEWANDEICQRCAEFMADKCNDYNQE